MLHSAFEASCVGMDEEQLKMYASGTGQLLVIAILVAAFYPFAYVALKLAQYCKRVASPVVCEEIPRMPDSMMTKISATLDTITPGIITRIVARIKNKLPSAAPPNTDPELGGGETALAEFEDSKVAGHTLYG